MMFVNVGSLKKKSDAVNLHVFFFSVPVGCSCVCDGGAYRCVYDMYAMYGLVFGLCGEPRLLMRMGIHIRCWENLCVHMLANTFEDFGDYSPCGFNGVWKTAGSIIMADPDPQSVFYPCSSADLVRF